MVHEFIESLPKQTNPAAKPQPAAATPFDCAPFDSAPFDCAQDLRQDLRPKPSTPPAESDSPPCPKCGSEMILRTAKRGDRKGKQFYGCSKYPKCRKMINID